MQNPSSPVQAEAYSSNGFSNESDSAVCWSAILGGTFTAIAISLALIAFGSGIGLASAAPWSHANHFGARFTCMAAIWLIVVQWISAGLGGYLTGRLRIKWVGVHTHEVFFRDTAHGFLTWAVATVVGAAVLVFTTSSALHHVEYMGMAGARQETVQHSATSGSNASGDSYYVDSLFRSDRSGTAADQGVKTEANHILMNGIKDGSLSEVDKNYLTQLVATNTGLALPDASKRVDDTMTQMRQSADEARKTAATVSIFTFLSMLIGAFVASAAAAFGGQQRDEPRRVLQAPNNF